MKTQTSELITRGNTHFFSAFKCPIAEIQDHEFHQEFPVTVELLTLFSSIQQFVHTSTQ